MKKKVWKRSVMAGLTAALICAVPLTVSAAEDLAKADADALEVVNSEDVFGNLTLPLEGENGSVITWESSDESVISTKADGDVAPGKVNRPAIATDVILTATITNEEDVETKEIVCHVRKAADIAETTDYLFSYFPYTSVKDERVYFGISEDGLNFDSLNGGKYVLESRVGTHGIRDPFIIRSPEGDKFFMIATDLTVAGLNQDGVKYPGMSWSDNQVRGSKCIVVWESDDLVNWSEERLVQVSVDNAGCTWAPEAYWDEETQQYAVFWASKTGNDNYGKQRVYMATTRDFVNFSEAKVWIEENGSVIDTTVIKVDDYYYRYTKNEAGNTNIYGTPSKRIYCERSKSLTSTDWEIVHANSLNISGGQIEGGCIFQINTDDVENAIKIAGLKGFTLDADEIYCLAADRTGATIFPGLTDDITKGNFDVLGTGTGATVNGVTLYSMPEPVASHGTIMPITSEEYDRVMKKYDEVYAGKAELYDEYADDLLDYVEIDTKEDLDAITKDVYLETDVDDDAVVVWSSSNEDVISNTGEVTRPSYKEGDQVVELTATLILTADDGVRDQVRRVSYMLTVKADEKPALPYTDVVEGDWFYDAVYYTFEEGLMTGMNPTTFGPYGQLSRGQFALMLYRMEGQQPVETTKTFADITGDEWYGPAVLWAAENGIVTGYQNGYFGPADMITREQMAVMMHRYANYLDKAVPSEADFAAFEDGALVSSFAENALGWATSSGIITGKDGGKKLDPQGNTTRAEAAVILQRFCVKAETIVSYAADGETFVGGEYFEGPVVINTKQSAGIVGLTDCTFGGDVFFNGSGDDRLIIDAGCTFEDGACVKVFSDITEATVDTPLPKVILNTPVQVDVKNAVTVLAMGMDAINIGGDVFLIQNSDYALSEDGASFVEFDPNAEYNSIGVSQWVEDGEEVFIVFAFVA